RPYLTPSLANTVLSARKRRNSQHLAGRELAGIGQQSLVGFKDQMIFAAMAGAIFGFGDLPQRVAGLGGIKLRFKGFGGGREIVLARGNARRIAARRRGLPGFPGRGGAARGGDVSP